MPTGDGMVYNSRCGQTLSNQRMKTLKVMNEAQFHAGEDARGVLVVLEPETELTNEHLDSLAARDAAGFLSDFTVERFEKPDERPALSYDRVRYAKLLAIAVSPRQGVRLRTLAGTGFLKLTVDGANIVETVMPPEKPRPQTKMTAAMIRLRDLVRST